MFKVKEGQKVPTFTGIDQHGHEFTSNNLLGKKYILFFYPKDDTPSCTAEACNLRDNYLALKKAGFEIIGVSADTQKKHLKYSSKYQLPFTLIADVNKEIIEAFGVWGLKKFMGRSFEGILRSTFVVNNKGIVEKVFEKVETKRHAEQIAEALGLSL